MNVLDEPVLGIWYVCYKMPADVIVVLRRFEQCYELQVVIREYDQRGNIKDTRTETIKKAPLPRSEAIDRVRSYIEDISTKFEIKGRWEALRGGRSLEQFGELIASMPHAYTRQPTPEEAAELRQRFGLANS